ncbi:unnamed protein product [Clavelina lepadiformis]|uniref:Nuclear speckle splicing regulatory protein 1 n=1 Tax=Clavelina lepadiformis TaxID=159417 RepID=A0ABP0GQN4_CLALP
MNHDGKYGLILRKKQPLFQKTKPSKLTPRLSVFSNADSSDEEHGQKEVNSQIHREAMKKIVKKQTKMEIQKALEEDATVYEYDSIYDDMKQKTNQKKIPAKVSAADKARKPKYIGSLMKAAESRGRERQRIEERKIEKERQKEGDEFKDKPEFVTSAYRKRMQEREAEEEEERRKAAIEEIMDVRKQKDLSGFYKHLLRQQVGEALPGERLNESEEPGKETASTLPEEDQDTDLSFSSSDDDSNPPEQGLYDASPKSSKVSSSSPSRDQKEQKKSSDSRRSPQGNRGESRRYRNSGRCRSDEDENYSRDHSRRSRSREGGDKRRDSKLDRKHPKESDDQRKRTNENAKTQSKNHERRRRSRSNSPEQKLKKQDNDCQEKRKDDKSVSSSKFEKRTNVGAAMSARDRYLARKKALKVTRAPVDPDSD